MGRCSAQIARRRDRITLNGTEFWLARAEAAPEYLTRIASLNERLECCGNQSANLYAHVTETLQAHHAERIEHVMGGALAAAVNGAGALDFTRGKSNVSQKPTLSIKTVHKYRRSVVAPTGIESGTIEQPETTEDDGNGHF
jgi:hypothetical protein